MIKNLNEMINKIKKTVVGLAVGDALGLQVVYAPRSELDSNPVVNLREFGTYNQPQGTWSEATSLTLATMHSLSKCGIFDYEDMVNEFTKWLTKAEYTANGIVFDVSMSCNDAISRSKKGVKAIKCGSKEASDSYNGSLTRMIPLIYWCSFTTDKKTIQDAVFKTSSITHASKLSRFSCLWLVDFGINLLNGMEKFDAYKKTCVEFHEKCPEELNRLLSGDIYKLPKDEIKSGDNVVETLEAVIYSFLTTNNYTDAVLNAVNLGNETDKIGALTGGIAGLYYNDSKGCPKHWSDKLRNYELIDNICQEFSAKYDAKPKNVTVFYHEKL